MTGILGPGEAAQLMESLESTNPVVGVRMHPEKSCVLKKSGERIPWTRGGWLLPERPAFTLDPGYHGGAYYVQDPSSMLLEWICNRLPNQEHAPLVLDMAAAPGGKSLILADWVREQGGLLVANEVIRTRQPLLRHNLARWGAGRVLTSGKEAQCFIGLASRFDVVLLDAPCSGEGLFRKDQRARLAWSPDHVKHCSLRQRRILAPLIALLRAGGVFLYSTCTFNPEENDEQVRWLCQQYPLEVIQLPIPEVWGIVSTPAGGLQCFPHRIAGEGFYLAALIKTTENSDARPEVRAKGNRKPLWQPTIPPETFLGEKSGLNAYSREDGQVVGLPREAESLFFQVSRYLPEASPALQMGNWRGRDFLPAAELALSPWVFSETPRWNLERYEALVFLKKEVPDCLPMAKGWGLATYGGLPLGWYKHAGGRLINHFPKAWRILKDLPRREDLPPLPFGYE